MHMHPSRGFRHLLPLHSLHFADSDGTHGAQELSLDFRVQLAKLIIALSRRDEAEVVRLDKVGAGDGPLMSLGKMSSTTGFLFIFHDDQWCSIAMLDQKWLNWLNTFFPCPEPQRYEPKSILVSWRLRISIQESVWGKIHRVKDIDIPGITRPGLPQPIKHW